MIDTIASAEEFRVQFCSRCGGATERKLPAGDNNPRDVCSECGYIHYRNPINVVGTIPVFEGKVLLCQRNIEPQKGLWTLPAGFMELGETLVEGAYRETIEEAGLDCTVGKLFSVVDVSRIAQVHFYYLAEMHSPQINCGHETMQAQLFDEKDVPWELLAFASVQKTLEKFFVARREGRENNKVFEFVIN